MRGGKVGSTNHVAQPTCPCYQPTSSLYESLEGGPLCLWLVQELKIGRFASVVGPPIHVMLLWRLMIGSGFAPWIEGCDFPSLLAQILHSQISPRTYGFQ